MPKGSVAILAKSNAKLVLASFKLLSNKINRQITNYKSRFDHLTNVLFFF